MVHSISPTPPEPAAARHVAELRASFMSRRSLPLAWRLDQLKRLRALVEERSDALCEALHADLGKAPFEAWTTEVGVVRGEIDYALKHVAAWTEPEYVSTPWLLQPASARIDRQPYGVVLIIAPWNYPLQLQLAPLIGAIAAGNCAILKPSELAPRTSQILAELLPAYLDPQCFRVVEGGAAETQALLAQKFDYIFFTGGTAIGRVIMEAAAKHLTPLTLELGGKSPCIVDKHCDLDVAARRIVWGKFINAGQTCIAPDYVLAHTAIERPLLDKMAAAVRSFYGADPKTSGDYSHIVNRRHFQRLTALIDSGERVVGGETDESALYIAPTILRNVAPDAPAMRDEIFGPILPVLAVPDVDAAIAFVNERPKPLALYVFSKNRKTSERVLALTDSGGACVNTTVEHFLPPGLPFGGVGASGVGAYHGRASFETFSHRRSILDKATWLDPRLRYPPYRGAHLKWAKRFL